MNAPIIHPGFLSGKMPRELRRSVRSTRLRMLGIDLNQNDDFIRRFIAT
jgi:hypothetical protein